MCYSAHVWVDRLTFHLDPGCDSLTNQPYYLSLIPRLLPPIVSSNPTGECRYEQAVRFIPCVGTGYGRGWVPFQGVMTNTYEEMSEIRKTGVLSHTCLWRHWYTFLPTQKHKTCYATCTKILYPRQPVLWPTLKPYIPSTFEPEVLSMTDENDFDLGSVGRREDQMIRYQLLVSDVFQLKKTLSSIVQLCLVYPT